MFSLLTRLILWLFGRQASPRMVTAVIDAIAFAAVVAVAAGLYWRGLARGAATEKVKCDTAQLEQDKIALEAQVASLHFAQQQLDQALAESAGREAAMQLELDRMKSESDDYVAHLDAADACRLSAGDVERLRRIAVPPAHGRGP